MVLAVGVLSELAFHGTGPLVYLTFPGLLWAALRFGPRGATLAVAVTVGIAVWDTTHLLGPFAFQSIPRSTLNLQLYIAVAALSTLLLAAVVAERELFAERLRCRAPGWSRPPTRSASGSRATSTTARSSD